MVMDAMRARTNDNIGLLPQTKLGNQNSNENNNNYDNGNSNGDENEEEIDIVYLWVNGSDPSHIRKRADVAFKQRLKELLEERESIDGNNKDKDEEKNDEDDEYEIDITTDDGREALRAQIYRKVGWC